MVKVEKKKMDAFWHATSHVLADAVTRLFPRVKLGIGPAIANGFYYDFDLKHSFTAEDLKKIEQLMVKITKDNLSFKRVFLPRRQAEKVLADQPYKLDLLKDIKGEKISFYQHGEFIDLCAGPLIKSTGQIKAFRLLNIAGAYWRGSEKNPMLQRIYGVSFPSKAELDTYLKKIEESAKRDHLKLGRQLDLFSIPAKALGPGLVLWHPKGAVVRGIIEDFLRAQHRVHGYYYVYTPHIASSDLWRSSGHLDFFKESLYPLMEVEHRDYLLKPMNCPLHVQIYKSKTRSYRDLPVRFFELGTVYRYERSGTLHGLTRVRGFTQDDAHIFCTSAQLADEVGTALNFAMRMLKTFGFKDFKIELSVRDPKEKEKYMGSEKIWRESESALKRALDKNKLKYMRAEGEAIFYGPKIDIKLVDALGRPWQGPTIQVDFNLPEGFNLTYVGEDNREHRVVMIHRALLGSIERFFGLLIEHYGGAFPLWLAPVQIRILSLTTRNVQYSKNVFKQFLDADLRVELDTSAATAQYKIRDAELQKIPYILVVGDKEQKNQTVAVRKRGVKGVRFGIKIEDFIKQVKKEIKNKK